MVTNLHRSCVVSLLCVCFGVATAEDAITPEMLRAMSQRAQDQKTNQGERATAAQPLNSLPRSTVNDAQDTLPGNVPQATKYGPSRPASKSDQDERRTWNNKYSPPPVGGAVNMDVAKTSGRRYGIRLGTVLYAEIRRNISSAEPGDAEIWLTRDVVGDKKTLPPGTQIFARMVINSATKRMEMITHTAISPDGDEFEIKARVFDTNQVSGLSGIVSDVTEGVTQKGASRALIAAGKSAIGTIAGETPAGAAVSAGAGSVLSDTDQQLQAVVNTNIVIYVSPQPVILRVDKTF